MCGGVFLFSSWELFLRYSSDHVSKPHTWTKPAYFYIRYVTLFDVGCVAFEDTRLRGGSRSDVNHSAQTYFYSPRHSSDLCSRWYIWELVFLMLLKMIVELVLMMRSASISSFSDHSR